MGFEDVSFAAKMRDLTVKIAEGVVERLRPSDSFATVISVSWTNLLATVVYPGETDYVPVSFGPRNRPIVGDVVRISGSSSDRHISEVMNNKLMGAKIWRNVDQAITSGVTSAIVFTTLDDANPAGGAGIWDGASALYCPAGQDGKYMVIGRNRWTVGAVMSQAITAVTMNGTIPIARDSVSISPAAISNGTTQEAIAILEMVAGDYVQLNVNYAGTTANANTQDGTLSVITPRTPSLELWKLE